MFYRLHHLLQVAETGSFTAAARAVHLTQPALSTSIARLEDELGARLLHRHARGATPTAAGAALLPHARAAAAAVEAGRRAVAEVQGLARGRVRIGGGATACTHLLPPVLARFHTDHPGIDLRVRETYTPSIRAEVAQGRLDLGIAQAGGADPDDLTEWPWVCDRLVLVAAPRLAQRLHHTGGQLAPGTPVVAFSTGASLRRLLDAALPDAEVAVELASIAAVQGHARAGLGVALLSRRACAVDLERGALVEVTDRRAPRSRELVIVHADASRLAPAARALLAALRDAPADT
jgi:DNA-binding transcriptional LysR family regulator